MTRGTSEGDKRASTDRKLIVTIRRGEEGPYRTRYTHPSMLLITEGVSVRRKEVVALSRWTGRFTAPHLHFEVLQDGIPIDPLSLVA